MVKYTTSRINYLTSGNDSILKDILKKYIFKNNICDSSGCRSPYVKFNMTAEEAIEYTKCKNDIIYFAENYYKTTDMLGQSVNIKLRQYQIDILLAYVENSTIVCSSRQSGISTLNKIYAIWSVLFDIKYVQIIYEPTYSLYNFIQSLISIYSKIPFFMQKGIVSRGRNEILFEDTSRISSIQPRVIDKDLAKKKYTVIVENCAHMRRSSFSNIDAMLKQGYNIHITSSLNGYESFYRLWQNSLVDNRYGLKAFSIYWNMLPELNENWADKMILNIGQENFNEEYNLIPRSK